jgi:hypothetical protein
MGHLGVGRAINQIIHDPLPAIPTIRLAFIDVHARANRDDAFDRHTWIKRADLIKSNSWGEGREGGREEERGKGGWLGEETEEGREGGKGVHAYAYL